MKCPTPNHGTCPIQNPDPFTTANPTHILTQTLKMMTQGYFCALMEENVKMMFCQNDDAGFFDALMEKNVKMMFYQNDDACFFGVFLATYNLLSSKKRWYELMKNTQKLAKIIRNAFVWKLTFLVWNDTFIQEKCCEFCELSKNDVFLFRTLKQKKGEHLTFKSFLVPSVLWPYFIELFNSFIWSVTWFIEH